MDNHGAISATINRLQKITSAEMRSAGVRGLLVYCEAGQPERPRALQAYLGDKNIQHTVRYTELSPDRFKDFWR